MCPCDRQVYIESGVTPELCPVCCRYIFMSGEAKIHASFTKDCHKMLQYFYFFVVFSIPPLTMFQTNHQQHSTFIT